MTDKQLQIWIQQRAEALAVIVFTRRDGISVLRGRPREGFDLLVEIGPKDKLSPPSFGILARGDVEPVTAAAASKHLKPTFDQLRGKRSFPIPVCAMFFNMRNNDGHFAWVAEPLVVDGTPQLAHHTKAECIELTNELVAQVIERVVAWHDATEAVPAG